MPSGLPNGKPDFFGIAQALSLKGTQMESFAQNIQTRWSDFKMRGIGQYEQSAK